VKSSKIVSSEADGSSGRKLFVSCSEVLESSREFYEKIKIKLNKVSYLAKGLLRRFVAARSEIVGEIAAD
jgi:hypothetical protein